MTQETLRKSKNLVLYVLPLYNFDKKFHKPPGTGMYVKTIYGHL